MPDSAVVHCESIEAPMGAGPDLADITVQVNRIVAQSGVQEGSVHLSAIGSTASITTLEFEPGAIADLKRAVESLAPPTQLYAHEMTWRDGNGHSHVQAALLGPSLVVAVRKGALRLGTWQQIVLINHDIHARRREVEITVIGRT